MSDLTNALIAAKLLGNGGGGGGGGLPPISKIESILVAEQSVTVASGQGMIAGSYSINEGDALVVSWNGTDYPCTVSSAAIGTPAWGNLSLVGAGADTGEPFFMGYMGGTGIAIMTSTDGTYTVSIGSTSYSPASGSIIISDEENWVTEKLSDNVPVLGRISSTTAVTVPSGDIYIYQGAITATGFPASWKSAACGGYCFVTNGDGNPVSAAVVTATINLEDNTARVIFFNLKTSSTSITGGFSFAGIFIRIS